MGTSQLNIYDGRQQLNDTSSVELV